MAILSELSEAERKHWELHLNAALKDTPALRKEVRVLLGGGNLPDIRHPGDIHDWLEIPELRAKLEA